MLSMRIHQRIMRFSMRINLQTSEEEIVQHKTVLSVPRQCDHISARSFLCNPLLHTHFIKHLGSQWPWLKRNRVPFKEKEWVFNVECWEVTQSRITITRTRPWRHPSTLPLFKSAAWRMLCTNSCSLLTLNTLAFRWRSYG